MTFSALGVLLALAVGLVLGFLGGGGSILAVPIFLVAFHVPTKPAIAMSLVVVGMSAFVGFLSHWRQGTVNLRVALTFGGFAMGGAFAGARVSRFVPQQVQLAMFAVFAFTAALLMLRDASRPAPPAAASGSGGDREARFAPVLALQAVGVGVLTALIGAGGGFVIVPALVLLARLPVKQAVGSSLLIIAMNALTGFIGYLGVVPIDWHLVGWFASFAAVGAMLGTRFMRAVPQRRIKQGFAVMILVLGAYLLLTRL